MCMCVMGKGTSVCMCQVSKGKQEKKYVRVTQTHRKECTDTGTLTRAASKACTLQLWDVRRSKLLYTV